MAMKPFWAGLRRLLEPLARNGQELKHPPKLYHVNWFRRDAQNKFLWPGYGENLRVLAWILERCAGRGGAVERRSGSCRPADLDLRGLDIAPAAIEQLSVDRELWKKEAADIARDLEEYGSRTPAALKAELPEATPASQRLTATLPVRGIDTLRPPWRPAVSSGPADKTWRTRRSRRSRWWLPRGTVAPAAGSACRSGSGSSAASRPRACARAR